YLCFPMALVLSTLALSQSQLFYPVPLLWFLIGAFSWTLLEYILHRWLLHYQPQSALTRVMLNRLHIDHHHHPRDESIVCIPFILIVPLWGVVLASLLLFGGGSDASLLFTCGLALMMVLYDITHFSTHYMKAPNKFLKMLKKNHLFHHFKDSKRRFGVTTPFWDFIFGTY
ncbi:MAG: sterol desaturase family protein, partial [Planctomycetota bacterium]